MRLAREQLDPVALVLSGARTARRWSRLLSDLPDELQQTLEALRAGRIAVEFRFHDEDRVTESLVGGIVAGSSILAASQLLSRRAAVRADTRRGRSRGQPRVASAASSSSRMRAQASTSSGVPDSSNSNSTGRPDFSASSRAAAW